MSPAASAVPPIHSASRAGWAEPMAPVPFRIDGPLPRGLTLLEASAGTGKTFAIAALVARYVAEGTPLSDLLIITFTRAATGELRDRVRQRLRSSERAVARHLAGGPAGDDVLDLYLSSGRTEQVATHRRRLAGALADFDRATIVTTHAFCEEVLRGLGTTGDVDRDVTFLEDPRDLLTEVVDDLFVRKFLRSGSPAFTRREAGEIADAAVKALGVDLEPTGAPPESAADLRYRFAVAARAELDRRKRRANTLGYDDILRSLAETLDPPGSPRAAAAARRLQDRYQVVLVDEFQDTDPTQWKILHRGFEPDRGGSTLVLVGDPKQAIYSFRGADVWTYLEAAAMADEHQTLDVNRRSDQGLLDGIGALFHGAALGHMKIRYRPARAAPANQMSRLVRAPVTTPVRIRVIGRHDRRLELDSRRTPTVASVRQVIARDLAADVVGLLGSGAELLERAEGGRAEGGRAEAGGTGGDRRRPLEPGDVAVLVGTNREAALVRTCLEEAGVPAVINGGGNVFATAVATQWLQLLEALERPSFTNRARAVALTFFVGWNAPRLTSADDAEIDALQATLHVWAGVLDRQGVAALVELITVTTGLPARVLGRSGGERILTDLRHVGELLHAEAVASHIGIAALTAWMRRRIGEGERTDAAEERSRRLESDAAAVQVLTIHRSKGLEFPVVYLPDLGEHVSQFYSPPTYHDPDTGRRTLDIGGDGSPEHQGHRRRFEDEESGEDLRQAYVALTRARQQVVLWWGPFKRQGLSPLGCLVFGDRAPDGVITACRDVPADDGTTVVLDAVAARAPGCVAVEAAVHPPRTASPPGGTAGAGRRLEVRIFDRHLDVEWRRTSYTAITAAAHDAAPGEPAVSSEPEQTALADERSFEPQPLGLATAGDVESSDEEIAVGEDEPRLRSVPSPMAALPRGAGFGIVVHAALEEATYDGADPPPELLTACRSAARFAPAGLDPLELSVALDQVVDTPLGPLVGNRRLRDVNRADRLTEVGFELPLVGGDRPHAELDVQAITALLRRRLPAGDPLAGYPERLADPAFDAVLRGYLTGSIDLLMRVGSGSDARFVVVDYKTNWLGPTDEPLTTWAYRPEVLAEAMVQAHYPLQALLYAVATHRYLRWRQPGYDPVRNLGGVLYLFVRGMAGASTPLVDGHPCGVFSWRPAAALIVELSDLLDRGDR